MHLQPKTIHEEKLATEALKKMQENQINGLLVVNEHNILVGALNMHDLLVARII